MPERMGHPEPLPRSVETMQPAAASELPVKPGWIYEPKYDGHRGVAAFDGRRARLVTRHHASFLSDVNDLLLPQLQTLEEPVVLDGEIVKQDDEGRISLADMGRIGGGTPVYWVFDILHRNGEGLTSVPLARRKEVLREVLAPSTLRPNIHLVADYDLETLIEIVKMADYEGVVAKNPKSIYRQGTSHNWLKFKNYTWVRGEREKVYNEAFRMPPAA